MSKNQIHRALVLQGGGALGAYEAGVLKILCKNLVEQDKENGRENKNLFDIVAGTSIGATNGSILVSQFLKTKSWEKAADKLEKFWTKQLSLKCLDLSDINTPWYNEWIKRTSTAASEEAARRYYSVLKLLFNKVRNNMYYQCKTIDDTKFFFKAPVPFSLHSSKPLQESIEKYAKFPIATTYYDDNRGSSLQQQPRLLVFSVDVAEGQTVTFDSYPRSDGSRRSEYGKENEIVIQYNDGIGINHVMASNTLPEFYDYAPIGIDSKVEQKNQDESCRTDKSDKKNTRYFCDGGYLSNTPLRELLQAHQVYWTDVNPKDKIPDLDVYIINVHPSKMDIDMLPSDYDGIEDRDHDILFGDRTSLYDEKISYLITDYTNFATQLKNLVEEAISKASDKDNREELNEKLKAILATKTISKARKDEARAYHSLLKESFKITKVVRIERTNYINSISGKTGDLTFETIHKLIREGECDAWFSVIHENIKNIIVDDKHTHTYDIQDKLIDKLNEAMKIFRKNDYEDCDSKVYHCLTEFIHIAKKEDKSEPYPSAKLVKYAEAFRDVL